MSEDKERKQKAGILPWGSSFTNTKIYSTRDFRSDRPNSKWGTDISYIHTKQGVLYLSMIRDLYDNNIVVCKTGTQQTVNLVLDTIRFAMRKESHNHRLSRWLDLAL